jgi:glycosyltransferase involved in cell wall biosynthesis
LEAVFIDDGSTDKTAEIVESLIAQNSKNQNPIKYKLIRNPKNQNVYNSRNTGIKNSNGEYLTYLDADDEFLPQSMENFAKFAKEYDYPDIICGQYKRIENGNVVYQEQNSNAQPQYIKDVSEIRKALYTKNGFSEMLWAKLIKKSFVIENNLLFCGEISHHEDLLAVYKIYKNAKTALFLPLSVYVYHVDNSSLTRTQGDKYKNISSFAYVLEKMTQNVESEEDPHAFALFIVQCIKYNFDKIKSEEEKSLLPRYAKIYEKVKPFLNNTKST